MDRSREDDTNGGIKIREKKGRFKSKIFVNNYFIDKKYGIGCTGARGTDLPQSYVNIKLHVSNCMCRPYISYIDTSIYI
jgi:hypothetical protein